MYLPALFCFIFSIDLIDVNSDVSSTNYYETVLILQRTKLIINGICNVTDFSKKHNSFKVFFIVKYCIIV